MKLKNMFKNFARFFGVEISGFDADRFIDTQLKSLLEKNEIDLVLDVGANSGQYYKMLRDIGYNKKVISFEPGSSAFAALAELDADPRWIRKQMALSDSNDTLKLNIYSSELFSSFLSPSEFGVSRFSKEVEIVRQELVDVSTVDEVLLGFPDAKVFLKMDTQGFDLKILAGARNSLDKIHLIQSEVSISPIYDGMPTYYESFSAFADAGFRLAGLFAMNRDDAGCMVEADAIFVRSVN